MKKIWSTLVIASTIVGMMLAICGCYYGALLMLPLLIESMRLDLFGDKK